MLPPQGCNALGVVLVDDEHPFRISLAEMLQDDGHDVRAYGAPVDLPPLRDLDDVAILVTDFEMPGRNGLTIADEFHTHYPQLPVLIVTAYHTQTLDAQALQRPFLRIVSKPVDYDALHALIHLLVDRVPGR